MTETLILVNEVVDDLLLTCPFMFQVTMQMQRSELLEKSHSLSTTPTVFIPS